MFAAPLVWLTPRSIAVEVDEAHALPGSATDDAPRQSK